MGIFDKLFGDEPKVTTRSTLSGGQQRVMEQLTNYLSGLGPIDNYRGPEYTGELSAGASDLEQLSLTALEDFAKSLVAGGGTSDLRRTGEQTLMDIMQAGPTDFEDYYRTGIQEPMLREFEEEILPRVSRRFAPSGFYGSERVRADTNAREDLLDALVAGRAELGFRSRESMLDRALQGAQVVPSYETTGTSQLLSLLEAGGAARGIEQGALDREYQDFLRRIGAKDTAIQQMLAALGIQTQQAVVNPGSTGLIGSIAPALGGTNFAKFL